MQHSDANKNTEWVALLGDNTAAGTLRLLGLIVGFIVIGGTVFNILH